jgi:hypothetical protein
MVVVVAAAAAVAVMAVVATGIGAAIGSNASLAGKK